jgi:GT2 family glycosyltransferase
MLYTFKSAAGGDVIMFGDVAKKLVAILGKDPDDPKGIVTVEQLPDAIARLRAAIDEDKARQAAQSQDDNADQEADPERRGMAAPVGFAQRAWPLLEMLELSQKDGVPVVWGV